MKRTDIKADGTVYWIDDSNAWADRGHGNPGVALSAERWSHRGRFDRTTATMVTGATGQQHAVPGVADPRGALVLVEVIRLAGNRQEYRYAALVPAAHVRGTEEDCRRQIAEQRTCQDAARDARAAKETLVRARCDVIATRIAEQTGREPSRLFPDARGHAVSISLDTLEALLGLDAAQDGDRS